jgi:uncharacterized membrane protein YfcA
MYWLDISLLTFAAFATSALTAVAGAGGGTILIALMLLFMPPAAAIPAHGVVQLASNTWRVWLFRRHMAWPLIIRFSLLLPLGVWLGLEMFQGMSKEVVQILIGCFVLLTLFLRHLKRFAPKEFPLWAFIPLGFVTGALNMIVGVIAPVLGALIIRKDLKKEDVVGTLGFFGFIGNLFKIAAFTLVGFSFAEYGLLLVLMTAAVVVGTSFGKKVLTGFNEKTFLIVFNTMLIALALKLIVIDGLRALLAGS